MSDHPYQRQTGDKPIYSPEQTERYKSMWERHQKSLCMRPDFVEEQDDGTQVYRFLSPRSPTGDWEVSKKPNGNLKFGFEVTGILGAVGTDGSNYNFSPSASQYFDDPNTNLQGTISLKEGLSYPVERLLQGDIYVSLACRPAALSKYHINQI
ncbi:hypothetical protein LC593_24065 [Nostoc sp. CHAB 5844]|nr:hypothetical protein [Nostoc sp. CHAB 5844]